MAFEAHKLLLCKNTASVEEMMLCHVLEVLDPIPSHHAVALYPDFLNTIHAEKRKEEEPKPERSFLHEIEVSIIVHWSGRSGHVIVNLVGGHEVFELESVL